MKSLEERIWAFLKAPLLNFETLETVGDSFYYVFEIGRKGSLLRINHFDLTGGEPAKEFPIRIQFVLMDEQSCAFSSSNLFTH